MNWTSGVCEWDAGVAGEDRFDVLFTGDLCPNGRTEPKVLAGGSRDILADALDELGRKDLSIVNLEAPLTRADSAIRKSGPNLKADPECLALLEAGQWDVACCANNHIGDYGPAEVVGTLRLLRDRGFLSVGAGDTLDSAGEPLFIEKAELTVAVLAFAENEFGSAGCDRPGSNPLNPARNIGQIRETAKRADLTIVLVHGGNEYLPVPSPRMRDTYRAFAEAGASAVVANHTHCPQGIELWNGTPIVYSMGNFIFDTVRPYGGYLWWYGSMVRIGFSRGHAVRIEVIPHHCAPSAESVTLLRGAERTRFLNYLERLCAIAADETEGTRYFDAWCVRWVRDGGLTGLGQPFYPPDWNDPESVERFLMVRNLHTCEAHAELLTNALRIVEERREEAAEAYHDKLDRLLAGEIA